MISILSVTHYCAIMECDGCDNAVSSGNWDSKISTREFFKAEQIKREGWSECGDKQYCETCTAARCL